MEPNLRSSPIIRRRRIINHGQGRQSYRTAVRTSQSWEDAVQGVVSEASKTLRNIRSVYIKEFTAAVEHKKGTAYRVNAKVTFEMERGA
jgi:dodecin